MNKVIEQLENRLLQKQNILEKEIKWLEEFTQDDHGAPINLQSTVGNILESKAAIKELEYIIQLCKIRIECG